MRTGKIFFFLWTLFLAVLVFPQTSEANNLAISNVRMGARNPTAKTLAVYFDISWENSWRNKLNHDAAWITLRLSDPTSSEKKLSLLTASGLSPAGVNQGDNASAEIYIPSDKVGALIRRSSNSPTGDFSSKGVMLTLDYGSCGFSESANIEVTVVALEMVYVPAGSFYAGDNAGSTAAFMRGAADTAPWPITGESALSVTGSASGGFYYTSSGGTGEFATGSSFIIPAAYPKGYQGFYLMKYEITEAQWVEFVNALPAAARSRRDLTDDQHKNSDAVIKRNTISCSGSPLVCVSSRPSRALGYLNWMDVSAFLDWAGLRPITELEFEKAARGPYLPSNGEYAWGSTTIAAAAALSGTDETGEETITNSSANANFNNVVFSGGDAAKGEEYEQGPLRSGIFSTSTSDRTSSGAGNYGAMELSGNLKEIVVPVGHTQALLFTGVHGDGALSTRDGFEGNADVTGWPGMDVDTSKGVTSASGTGFRGGSWADPASRLRISDRQEAVSDSSVATPYAGGRGARTYDGE